MKYWFLSLTFLPSLCFSQQQMATNFLQNNRQNNIQLQTDDLLIQNQVNSNANITRANRGNFMAENNTGTEQRKILVNEDNRSLNPVSEQKMVVQLDNVAEVSQESRRINNSGKEGKSTDVLIEKSNDFSMISVKTTKTKSSAKKYRNVKKGYCQKGRAKKSKANHGKNSRTSGMRCYQF